MDDIKSRASRRNKLYIAIVKNGIIYKFVLKNNNLIVIKITEIMELRIIVRSSKGEGHAIYDKSSLL